MVPLEEYMLKSHTLMLLTQIIDQRLITIEEMGNTQFGLSRRISTIMDPREILQKKRTSRKCKKKTNMVFADLENACDKVPRDLIWCVVRQKWNCMVLRDLILYNHVQECNNIAHVYVKMGQHRV